MALYHITTFRDGAQTAFTHKRRADAAALAFEAAVYDRIRASAMLDTSSGQNYAGIAGDMANRFVSDTWKSRKLDLYGTTVLLERVG